MLGGVVVLVGAVERVDAADEGAGEAGDRHGELVRGQRNVVELAARSGDEVNVFLVGLPRLAGLRQKSRKVLRGVLVGGTFGSEGIVIVEHAEVGAGLGPDVVRLRGMDVGVAAVGGGEDVVIGRGVGDLLADVLGPAADLGPGGAVNEAVDERRVGVLEDLLCHR